VASQYTSVRRINGVSERETEHFIWIPEPWTEPIDPTGSLRPPMPLPAETACKRSTAGMKVVEWNDPPWPYACSICAAEIMSVLEKEARRGR
jgi:hypothetical protein